MSQEVRVTPMSAVRGDTWEQDFLVGGSPTQVIFSVYRPAATEPLIVKTFGDGIAAIDAGLRVTLDPADTAGMPPVLTTLHYKLIVVDEGITTTRFQGPFRIFA